MNRSETQPLPVRDLGRRRYAEALDIQHAHAEAIEQSDRLGVLLLAEHPPVLTVGRMSGSADLGRSAEEWRADGVEVRETDRGGQITYHGPGQIVLYPILHLRRMNLDLHSYIRNLEQTGIALLDAYGIEARRDPDHTGVWAGDAKVAAIGIHVRRWITTHGMAININVPLDVFRRFVPCGITDRGVTSLAEILGHEANMDEARERLLKAFANVFNVQLKRISSTG